MDILLDDSEVRLAQRIRLERQARGWSIADLARESDVSKAAISKIERGETSPTAGVLVRIAAAFDLTLAGLLVRAEGDEGRLIRAGDQPVWQDPDSHYLRRQVFMRPGHPLELVEVEMPAGQKVEMPAASYAHIRQAVWVIEGRLALREGGERFELEAGDCLGFGAPSDVEFANEGNEPCRYLVALARS